MTNTYDYHPNENNDNDKKNENSYSPLSDDTNKENNENYPRESVGGDDLSSFNSMISNPEINPYSSPENLYNTPMSYQTGVHKPNTNWPDFLIDEKNQVIFGFASLLLTLISGLGIATGAYYLFYLDKKIEKNSLSKLLNGIAFALPAIGIVLTMLMFLLVVIL